MGSPVKPSRFVFIDAVRGMAAMGVVAHHAYCKGPFWATLQIVFPRSVQGLLDVIAPRGVQVFFVISGFVIAHSLRNTVMTAGACARFIARRQLRLDPPYWAMLLITLSIIGVSRAVPGATPLPCPGVGAVLANFAYLQHLLRLDTLLDVGWTLAIEIQFYIAFMVILAASRRRGPSPFGVALLLLTSITAAFTADPNVTYLARWAVNAWPYFVAGTLCYWAVQRQLSPWFLVAVLSAMIASKARFGLHSQVVVGVLASVAILCVGYVDRLGTLCRNRPIQFLGRISYSLYLTHILAVVGLQQLGYRLTHDNRPAAVMWYALSILVAVAIAYAFHLLIERPSMELATRFKGRQLPIAPAVVDEAHPGTKQPQPVLA